MFYTFTREQQEDAKTKPISYFARLFVDILHPALTLKLKRVTNTHNDDDNKKYYNKNNTNSHGAFKRPA